LQYAGPSLTAMGKVLKNREGSPMTFLSAAYNMYQR